MSLKKFAWIFVIIGGILAIIGLCVPAAIRTESNSLFTTDISVWIIGFTNYDPEISITFPVTVTLESGFDEDFFAFGIVVFVLMLMSAILTFFVGWKAKGGEISRWLSSIIGVLIIAAAIGWIIGSELNEGFAWADFTPAGIFIPFIGGALILISSFLPGE